MCRARIARLLAVACAVPLVLTSLASPATAVQVPPQAWITIKGHGYGHGHGMSQYGAQGAAMQGLGFRQIAQFYYPGTTWGTVGGSVRVRISADTTDDLVVLARSGLRLHESGNSGTTRLPDNGATRWRLRVNSKGQDQIDYLLNGGWRTWRTVNGEGGFSAGRAPVTLVTPAGSTQYRGRLWAEAPPAGGRARDTVNVVSLENYLKGVVPREMPALWKPAAVQAQAVAARTYAAQQRDDLGTLCDTTSCQVYGGYSAEHPASNDAVAKTAKLALMWQGAPAFTQFSASSGGWTSAGSQPYLVAKKDPYDGFAGNPVHSWSVRISDTVIESHWPGIGNLTAINVNKRDGNGEWGGRVLSVTLVGGRGRITVPGDTLRSVLGLRSTWVTFVATQRG